MTNEMAGIIHALKDYIDSKADKALAQSNGHAQRVEFTAPKVFNDVPVPAVNFDTQAIVNAIQNAKFEPTNLQPVIAAVKDMADRWDAALEKFTATMEGVGEMLSQLVQVIAARPDPVLELPEQPERKLPILRLEVSSDGTKRIIPE